MTQVPIYNDLYRDTGRGGPRRNPQGALVAQERYDGTVSITDLRSGGPLGSFRLPSPGKSGMAFSPNGHILLTVTEDLPVAAVGQLQQWVLSESAWVRSHASQPATILRPWNGSATSKVPHPATLNADSAATEVDWL